MVAEPFDGERNADGRKRLAFAEGRRFNARTVRNTLNVTVTSKWQPTRQDASSFLTEEEIQIGESDAQFQNADPPMQLNLLPDSNVTVRRQGQPPKWPGLSFSTGGGTEIDESDEQNQNASSSITDRSEPDSNATVERD
jgi:hypothetical protein